MSGLRIVQPGLLGLLQDRGRFGAHGLGLTTGGPLDGLAFDWANRLLGNEANATAIELGFGGMTLESEVATAFAITGAEAPCRLNGAAIEQWRSLDIAPGDRLEIGFATAGTRLYVAVAGGFDVEPMFGSTATVTRERIGGLDGDKLEAGDLLPCADCRLEKHARLAPQDRPDYGDSARLRLVRGYQVDDFDGAQQWRFFNSEYRLTENCDRMGFRLAGNAVKSNRVGMLSEGICLGAVQIPADGQPIVLMNDRQTIGGYPKIGAVIAADTARLAQLRPGATVRFEAIGIEQAHNLHTLERARYRLTAPHWS